jgi:hypothetical protein
MMKSDGIDRDTIEALCERIARAKPKISERRNFAPRRRRASPSRPR